MSKVAPAPLSASLLGVPKGSAAPAAELPTVSPELSLSRAGAPERRLPEVVPPPIEEPRTALTVRLPLSTQERLREAAFRTRREKQVIVAEALIAWLERRGY